VIFDLPVGGRIYRKEADSGVAGLFELRQRRDIAVSCACPAGARTSPIPSNSGAIDRHHKTPFPARFVGRINGARGERYR